jgi:hypothetical protein
LRQSLYVSINIRRLQSNKNPELGDKFARGVLDGSARPDAGQWMVALVMV